MCGVRPVRAHDIVRLAQENDAFRREVETHEHSQVVLMTIPRGGQIGKEVHEGIDQLLLRGSGRVGR